MTPQALIPALVLPLVGWRLYRRFRGSVGAQAIRPGRLLLRVGIFSLLGLLFLALAANSPPALAGAIAGLAAGAGLAIASLRLTRFEVRDGGGAYTPNPWIGGAVTAVLVARVASRFPGLAPAAEAAALQAGGSPDPLVMLRQGPLTTGVLMGVVAYYIVYCAGVLWVHRRGTPRAV